MTADIRNFISNNNEFEAETRKVSKNSKKAVITEVREKKNGVVNPVLVTFQNGELNENHASDFNVLFTPTESGKTNIEVHTSYGHVFKDSNYNETLDQVQLIAIRNKKTNKVRLIEVDSAVLINSALVSTPKQNVVATTDYGKDVQQLNRTFGGKKVKSRLEQRDKLNVNSSLVADEVKELAADITVEDTSLNFLNETESIIDLLPPCHRDTKNLSELYVLEEILNEDELKALTDEVSNGIIDTKNLSQDDYSQFFIFCHEKATKSQDNLLNRLAAILFAEVLIKFIKTPAKKLSSKKTSLCTFSSVIHSKLLNEFCHRSGTSVTRPVSMRDKCLCYIITVSLIACNYEINLKLLATVTSIHLNKLVKLARVVGAVPVSKDDSIYVLKLPLPALPKTSNKKVKRK